MEPTVYRVVEATPNGNTISLVITEDGIEDPNSNIVLMWQDGQGVQWAHWQGQDYRCTVLAIVTRLVSQRGMRVGR